MNTTTVQVPEPYFHEPRIGLEGTVVAVEFFWDGSLRLWTIYRVREDGAQVGSADYAPRRADAMEIVRSMTHN